MASPKYVCVARAVPEQDADGRVFTRRLVAQVPKCDLLAATEAGWHPIPKSTHKRAQRTRRC